MEVSSRWKGTSVAMIINNHIEHCQSILHGTGPLALYDTSSVVVSVVL